METISAQPQEPPNHKSKFQIYVLIGLIVVLIIVVVLDVLSFMGKIDFKGEDKETTKSSIIVTESKNPETVSNKPGKTWNDCKVLPNEKSYLPQYLNSEQTAVVQVKKKSVEEEGINEIWNFHNDYSTEDKIGKEVNGATPLNIVRKTLFGNESLITAISIVSGETGQEEVLTTILSLIEAHSMLVTVVVSGSTEKMSEAEEMYEKWFNTACQPK